jgi:hypothetical protein
MNRHEGVAVSRGGSYRYTPDLDCGGIATLSGSRALPYARKPTHAGCVDDRHPATDDRQMRTDGGEGAIIRGSGFEYIPNPDHGVLVRYTGRSDLRIMLGARPA